MSKNLKTFFEQRNKELGALNEKLSRINRSRVDSFLDDDEEEETTAPENAAVVPLPEEETATEEPVAEETPGTEEVSGES